MSNDSSSYCVKCGNPLESCLCDIVCDECDEPLFMCECGGVHDFCDKGCEQEDSACYHEVTICMICEAIIDDDAILGEEGYFCENCGDVVCADCAQPAVDETGEIVFVCKTCLGENRGRLRG